MIEYFTALVIAYSVQGQEIETAIWFSGSIVRLFMNSGSADGIYNHLYDLYGNDIMMVCHKSTTVSKLIKPKLKPRKEE